MTRAYTAEDRRRWQQAGREAAAAERAAQGLPPKIDDPTTLEKVATVVRRSDGRSREDVA